MGRWHLPQGGPWFTFAFFALAYPVLFEVIPDWRYEVVPLHWEGVLPPVALLFGASGIVGISFGTVVINLYLWGRGLEEITSGLVVAQFLAFLLSQALAYLAMKGVAGPQRFFVATAVLTLGLTALMGSYWTLVTGRPHSYLSILIATMVPTNLLAPFLMEALSRLQKVRAAEEGNAYIKT